MLIMSIRTICVSLNNRHQNTGMFCLAMSFRRDGAFPVSKYKEQYYRLDVPGLYMRRTACVSTYPPVETHGVRLHITCRDARRASHGTSVIYTYIIRYTSDPRQHPSDIPKYISLTKISPRNTRKLLFYSYKHTRLYHVEYEH